MGRGGHNKKSFETFHAIVDPLYPFLEFSEDEKFSKGRATAHCTIHKVTFDSRVDSFIDQRAGCKSCGSYAQYIRTLQTKSNEVITPHTNIYLYIIQVNEYFKIGISNNVDCRLDGFSEDAIIKPLFIYHAPLYEVVYLEQRLHDINKELSFKPTKKILKTGNTELFKSHPQISLDIDDKGNAEKLLSLLGEQMKPEDKLKELTTDIPEAEIVEVIEAAPISFHYAEATDLPLNETELALSVALGSGASEEVVLAEFNVSRKKLAELKRNRRFMLTVRETENDRIALMKAKTLGLVEKGIEVRSKQVEKWLDSNDEYQKEQAMKAIFGKNSILETTESLNKLQNPEDDNKDEKLMSFLAGVMVGQK